MKWPGVGPNTGVVRTVPYVLSCVVSNITLALGPPALDPTPVQATTAIGQPAALTDSLRGSLAVHLA